ncbi:MAG: hypothetical protein SNJ84_04055, partial [Verrucomicrobiia bacterium]
MAEAESNSRMSSEMEAKFCLVATTRMRLVRVSGMSWTSLKSWPGISILPLAGEAPGTGGRPSGGAWGWVVGEPGAEPAARLPRPARSSSICRIISETFSASARWRVTNWRRRGSGGTSTRVLILARERTTLAFSVTMMALALGTGTTVPYSLNWTWVRKMRSASSGERNRRGMKRETTMSSGGTSSREAKKGMASLRGLRE